ncbi:hypothetical protein, partial [Pseudomonas gingeri]
IHSSVKIDVGAAPSALSPIGTSVLATAIPLLHHLQTSQEGALLVNFCEFDANGNCKLHPHH